MSANGTCRLAWANGEDQFCIGKIEQLLDLEDKCGVGVFEIAGRLESVMLATQEGRIGGTAKVNDIRETIRLGLIGGGMAPDKAMRTVRTHVDGRPLIESILLAYEIIAAVLRGVPGDEVGKEQADRAKDQVSNSTATMGGSSDPQSTALGQGSDGLPESSISAPSGNSAQPSTGTISPTAASPNPLP